MSDLTVLSRTQRIIVDPASQVVDVISGRQGISITNAGPPGPRGITGPPGPPGQDAQPSVDTVMAAHVNSPTPHPVYDDMPDLVILFENGLF
jgi:hypothetical protein